MAAAAALDDGEWLRVTSGQVRATRDRLTRELIGLGWSVIPSSGNFLLAAPASSRRPTSPAAAEQAFEFLRARKILVRRFPHHPLTEKSLRISVGTEAEAEVFLAAAKAWTEG